MPPRMALCMLKLEEAAWLLPSVPLQHFAAPLSFLARLVGAFEEEEDLTIHGLTVIHRHNKDIGTV